MKKYYEFESVINAEYGVTGVVLAENEQEAENLAWPNPDDEGYDVEYACVTELKEISEERANEIKGDWDELAAMCGHDNSNVVKWECEMVWYED